MDDKLPLGTRIRITVFTVLSWGLFFLAISLPVYILMIATMPEAMSGKQLALIVLVVTDLLCWILAKVFANVAVGFKPFAAVFPFSSRKKRQGAETSDQAK